MLKPIRHGWRLRGVVLALALCAASVIAPTAHAQRGWFDEQRRSFDMERDIFPGESFTFCRVQYTSWNESTSGYWYGQKWATDYPNSDRNFSQRLEELTTIKVNRKENGEIDHDVVSLTDEELFNYPFLYLIEPGEMRLTDEEVKNLRSYLLRGGFLMVDDFWGDNEWANFEMEFSRVLPPTQYPMRELDLDHPVFNLVFNLEEKPQIPAVGIWVYNRVTWERPDAKTPRFRGVHDKNGRLMMIVCHNTDLGDGWEREAENKEYFEEFSAKKAYPLGINIVVYAMTH